MDKEMTAGTPGGNIEVKENYHYSGLALAEETGENDVSFAVTFGSIGTPQNIGELVREVDRHGTHPEEEADEGVVYGVPEEVAAGGEEDLLTINDVETTFDPVEEKIETGVQEESHHQLAEEVFPEVREEDVDYEGDEEEKEGDKYTDDIYNIKHKLLVNLFW